MKLLGKVNFATSDWWTRGSFPVSSLDEAHQLVQRAPVTVHEFHLVSKITKPIIYYNSMVEMMKRV